MPVEIIKTVAQVDPVFFAEAPAKKLQAVFDKAEQAYWNTNNIMAWYVELPALIKSAITSVNSVK